ncbi:MAG: hypothetical protein ACRD2L_25015 [Terriglobia bacterium]
MVWQKKGVIVARSSAPDDGRPVGYRKAAMGSFLVGNVLSLTIVVTCLTAASSSKAKIHFIVKPQVLRCRLSFHSRVR